MPHIPLTPGELRGMVLYTGGVWLRRAWVIGEDWQMETLLAPLALAIC